MRPLGSQRWHRALALFTGIFIFAVITQFAVGWYQRYTKALSSLSEEAEGIKQQFVYSERRDLTQYRQAEPASLSYYVVDSNGINIDILGYSPAMNLRVKLDDLSPGLQTVAVPETGETWRLFVKQLSGGIVILGVSPPEDITNVDKRLAENANRFGSFIDKALSIGQGNTIDRNLDYAIIDITGRLRYATGGIPLRIVSLRRFPSNTVEEVRAEDGFIYGVFSLPFRDSLKTGVVISVFGKLDPQPWFSLRHWIVNCFTSAILAFIGTLIGIPYIRERFEPQRLLHTSLQKGESATVEFKESLRWDKWHERHPQVEDAKKKASGEQIALKTMVALLNNRSGGTLFIGVADDKSIVGLDRDYNSLAKEDVLPTSSDKNHDRFQRCLRDLLGDKIGRDISNLYIQMAIVVAEGKDVCVVHASPSATPVYLPEGKTKSFFVRDGASTVQLDVEQAVAYVEKRWPRSLWRRIWNTLHIA